MRRFLAIFRFVAVGLLVLEGGLIIRAVVVTVSRLPGAML
jgi:hypothetical protein